MQLIVINTLTSYNRIISNLHIGNVTVRQLIKLLSQAELLSVIMVEKHLIPVVAFTSDTESLPPATKALIYDNELKLYKV